MVYNDSNFKNGSPTYKLSPPLHWRIYTSRNAESNAQEKPLILADFLRSGDQVGRPPQLIFWKAWRYAGADAGKVHI